MVAKKPTENPFQISYGENPVMGGFDVTLQVGNLKDAEECKKFGEALSAWLTEEGGWRARVQ